MVIIFVVWSLGVKEIDIAATLEHIRDQRPGLVHTKVWQSVSLFSCCLEQSVPFCLMWVFLFSQDQFEFALTAVAEEVNAILKALPQWSVAAEDTLRTDKKRTQCTWTHCQNPVIYVWPSL